jgi:hypothetical protein
VGTPGPDTQICSCQAVGNKFTAINRRAAATSAICKCTKHLLSGLAPLHNSRPATGEALEVVLFRAGEPFELHQYRFNGLVSGLDNSFAPGDPFRLARGARKLFCVPGRVRVHN